MFEIIEKIDRALETGSPCRLITKMGTYYRGKVKDSWARASSGKMRGKVEFETDDGKNLQIDVNDIMEIEESTP